MSPDKPGEIMLFKVLKDGKSFHGGKHTWSLPIGDTPGEWHKIAYDPIICGQGFHVTSNPALWWKEGCTVYVAEVGGRQITAPVSAEDPTKIAVQECRLLRLATEAELNEHRIFTSGSHAFSDGRCIVSGSATVTASGSATVTAFGLASVKASDSASVTAFGLASVTAFGLASVTAFGLASVTASGSALVSVRYGAPKVVLTEAAAEVSYLSGKPVLRTA
jgi:hypothetical protein